MKNKGFSFVELLVAVAILGIVSLPIVSSFALAAKTDAKAYHLSAMNDAADDVMLLLEEMKITLIDENSEPVELDVAFLEELEAFAMEELVITDPFSENQMEFLYNQYQVKLTLNDLENNYCRVDITVSHTVSGATLEVNRRGWLEYV